MASKRLQQFDERLARLLAGRSGLLHRHHDLDHGGVKALIPAAIESGLFLGGHATSVPTKSH